MNTLPSDIQSYFTEIAERLWTDHASVIVGAGFSKNAVNTVNPSKSAPDWGQLGDLLYEKIHNRKPGLNVKYLNLLKLAEEFEAAFGRSTLEHFIQKNIADNEYEPSLLHKMLMELPWTDVFTTNYDTLLERSCKDVLSRKYDIVINQKDLVYSNKPRIIKLHGSLPSERPFIITEEDYRVYPIKYAPFVNTVQQSLLENTLCLIGFSGDDPNFLKWIGWINDNLGYSNAPKIYLIGVLNLTESQKKLLSNKNIIAVDVSSCNDINGNHKKGLMLFINYLASQKNKRKNLDWPMYSDLKKITLDKNEDIASLLSEWVKCRNKYPNWIILPQKQRDRLWRYTEKHSHNESIFQNLHLFEDLDYAYELNWRLEKCLFPIWNKLAPYFQKILDRYNFFPNDNLDRKEINVSYNTTQTVDLNKYARRWIELSLSMLRFYREEDFENEWLKIFNELNLIKKHLSYEQSAHFYYEQILNAIFKNNHDEAKRLLSEWPQNNNSLFWEAKRAMLLTEFGQLKESANLLEFVLIEIRKRLNLSPIEDDYLWVSQEAYVMYQLNIVQQNIIQETLVKDEETKVNQEDFNERWNDLLKFKSDPQGEMRYFDIILDLPQKVNHGVTIKNDFQIGRSTRSIKFGGTPQDFLTAYTFLRYLDELAIPLSLSRLNIGNKSINGALSRIMMTSPTWGMAILNRCSDNSAVEVVFHREQLINLPTSTVNKYVKEYLKQFEIHFVNGITDPIAKAFIDKIPTILSRLCTKCSDDLRGEIFKFYSKIYKQQIVLPNFIKLFENLIYSSDKNTLALAAENLLDAPLLDSESYRAVTTFLEPFDYLKTNNIQKKLEINQNIVKDIFEKALEATGVRENAITRLIFLYEKKQLNKTQVKKLFDIIWQQKDKDGFPKHTKYYHFTFTKWPHPANINPIDLYTQYIAINNFNIQDTGNKKGISMSHGTDRYSEELFFGSKTLNNIDGIKWNLTQIEEILQKCEQWWNLDKHYLTDEKHKSIRFAGSIYEEFLSRFKNLTNIIARVFGIRKDDLNPELIKRIETLIIDMENHGVPVLKAKVTFGIYKNYNKYLKEVQDYLALKNKTSEVIDALESIILSVHCSPYKKDKKFLFELITLLAIPLKWNILELLGDVFDVLQDFILHSNIDLTNIHDDIESSLRYTLNMSTDELPLAEYLILRQKSISLASAIFIQWNKVHLPIPQIITEWKTIAESDEEFGDIKNRW